ncbi:hypothetical protein R4Y45_04040 [Holzapfeliella sp. He02]|uniref:Uncharacterized protein n=1 Tax=Holzapfeliella saturejae TaxID=3082953 RepID=A0ABU8SG85_9LACO
MARSKRGLYYYTKKLRGLRRIWRTSKRWMHYYAEHSDDYDEIPGPGVIPYTGKTRKFKQKYRKELFDEFIDILNTKISSYDNRFYLLFYGLGSVSTTSILIFDDINEVYDYFHSSNENNHIEYINQDLNITSTPIISEDIPKPYNVSNYTNLNTLYCEWHHFDPSGNLDLSQESQKTPNTIILVSNSEVIDIAKKELAYSR